MVPRIFRQPVSGIVNFRGISIDSHLPRVSLITMRDPPLSASSFRGPIRDFAWRFACDISAGYSPFSKRKRRKKAGNFDRAAAYLLIIQLRDRVLLRTISCREAAGYSPSRSCLHAFRDTHLLHLDRQTSQVETRYCLTSVTRAHTLRGEAYKSVFALRFLPV